MGGKKKAPDKIILDDDIDNDIIQDNIVIHNYKLDFDKILKQLKSKIIKHTKTTNTKLINGIVLLKDFMILIRDDECVPFWNDDIHNISNKIFLPIKENMEKSNTPKTFLSNTWFKTEHFQSIQYYDDLKIKNMKETEKNVLKTVKIRIYPTPIQKEYLKRIIGVHRYFYNRTIQYINNYDKSTKKTYFVVNYGDKEHINIDLSNVKNKFDIRSARKLLKTNYPDWMKDIPVNSHVIDLAIIEAFNRYNGCLKAFAINRKPFELKMKTKKDKYQTINIEKVMIKPKLNSILVKTKYKDKYIFKNLKTSDKISNYNNLTDSSITYIDKLDEFYINLGYNEKIKVNRENKICSVDPGIACFNVCYSDNAVHKIGIGTSKEIGKYCKEIDIMTSRIYKKKEGVYKNNYQKRRRIKKALHKKIKKIQNIKEELHNKTVKFLTDNYGRIIMPPFETQKMAEKVNNSRLARSLYNTSFYKFLIKLRIRCEIKGIEIIERPEYYTSKTCTRCGRINTGLKLQEREYCCSSCGIRIDRDINGARNIMLRNNKWELPPLKDQ